jgi:hypothetical protein
MSLNARINAAAAAVAAHTDALGIDDDGDAPGIGAWHLLYSLYGYCEEPGMFPLDGIAATKQDWNFARPFLVWVEPRPRDVAVVYSELPKEYEVQAANIEEACIKAVGSDPWRRSDVERRTTHDFYTEKYVAPDWNMYAGGGVVREGVMTSAATGLENAVKSGWMAVPPNVEIPRPDGLMGWVSPVRAAEFALETYKRVAGNDGDDRIRDVENLLRGLREYLTRFGEDFDEMLENVRSERAANRFSDDPDPDHHEEPEEDEDEDLRDPSL